MRILHCVNTLCSGGAEAFVVSLAIAQRNAGHEVGVFTYAGAIDSRGEALDQQLRIAGVSHTSPGIRKNGKKPLVPHLIARHIKRFSPDVVHSHLEQSDLFTWLAMILSNSRALLVRTIHTINATSKLPGFIHRVLGWNFDSSVACSDMVFNNYPYLGRSRHRIDNGINLKALHPEKTAPQVRRELGIKPEEVMLLNIGTFALHKGKLYKAQDIIIQALHELGEQQATIVFLGDGEHRQAMQALAEKFGIAHRCRFTGKVPNPIDYICAADAVVMPSRIEGLSIACIEAACAGKPLLVSRIEAFSPFMRPATLAVRPEAAKDLAESLKAMIDNLRQYKNMASSDTSFYRGKFDIELTANRYIDHYRNLALTRNKRRTASN